WIGNRFIRFFGICARPVVTGVFGRPAAVAGQARLRSLARLSTGRPRPDGLDLFRSRVPQGHRGQELAPFTGTPLLDNDLLLLAGARAGLGEFFLLFTGLFAGLSRRDEIVNDGGDHAEAVGKAALDGQRTSTGCDDELFRSLLSLAGLSDREVAVNGGGLRTGFQEPHAIGWRFGRTFEFLADRVDAVDIEAHINGPRPVVPDADFVNIVLVQLNIHGVVNRRFSDLPRTHDDLDAVGEVFLL